MLEEKTGGEFLFVCLCMFRVFFPPQTCAGLFFCMRLAEVVQSEGTVAQQEQQEDSVETEVD